eukprot:4207509-Pleurochrysis_carterae.AAC.3
MRVRSCSDARAYVQRCACVRARVLRECACVRARVLRECACVSARFVSWSAKCACMIARAWVRSRLCVRVCALALVRARAGCESSSQSSCETPTSSDHVHNLRGRGAQPRARHKTFETKH